MSTLLQDLRYGLRVLAKNPGFTAVAVLTLALGIGANTAVFSALNAAAFRPLPVKNPSDIVRVSRWVQQGYGGTLFSYPEYSYYRDHNSVFSGLLADACCYDILPGDLPAPIGPARSDATEVSRPLQSELVSANYFSALGVHAALGRAFLPEEGRTAGADPVVVLGYRYWQRQFASDPSIVGKTLTLNGTRFTVVGVSPSDFIGTGDPPRLPDVWVPLTMQAEVAPGSDWLDQPSEYRLRLVGRLKPGVTRKRAEAELTVLCRDLERES